MAYMDFDFWNLLRFCGAVLKLGTFFWLCQMALRRKNILWSLGTPFLMYFISSSLGGTSGKEPTWQCRRQKRRGFDPWVGKIPWRRAWQPSPVRLSGESHGQRATVHRVAQSWTWLKWLTTHTSSSMWYVNF